MILDHWKTVREIRIRDGDPGYPVYLKAVRCSLMRLCVDMSTMNLTYLYPGIDHDNGFHSLLRSPEPGDCTYHPHLPAEETHSSLAVVGVHTGLFSNMKCRLISVPYGMIGVLRFSGIM